MQEQIQHSEQREVVAVVQQELTADFVAATLAAHGIDAIGVECFGFPSVDFAQGIRVTVAVDQAEAARAVLRALGGVDPDEVDEAAEAAGLD
jgi:hypothetical protein